MRRRRAARIASIAIALVATVLAQSALAARAVALQHDANDARDATVSAVAVGVAPAPAVGVKLIRLPQPVAWERGEQVSHAPLPAAGARIASVHLVQRPRSQAQHLRLHPSDDEPPQPA